MIHWAIDPTAPRMLVIEDTSEKKLLETTRFVRDTPIPPTILQVLLLG
jgi:hypothetical protein